MNLKNKFLALTMAFIFILGNVTVFAADPVNPVELVDAAAKKAKILNAQSGTRVVVVDFSMDDDLDSVTDGVQKYNDLTSSAKSNILLTRAKHVKHITTSGDYVFTLPDFGIYTVFINQSGTVNNYALTVYNPDFETNHQTAANWNAIYSNFDLAKGYMKTELVNYYSLSSDVAGMQKICQTLFDRRASDADKAAIVSRTELISKLYKYSKLANGTDRKTAFEGDADINYTAFTDYADYNSQTNDSFKINVADRFLSFENLDGKDKFDNAFSQAMFLEKVKNTTTAAAVDQLVATAKTKFSPISTPKYDALGTYSSLASDQLKGQSFATVAKFIEKLEEAAGGVTIPATPTPTPPSTRPTRPSNSVSSGSVSISVPLTNTAPKEDTPTVEKPLYNDVEKDRWSYEPINILTKRGVLSGDETGDFRPEHPITREEFVKVVVAAFEMLNESAETDFTDVSASDWSCRYIASAKKYGIVNGKTPTEFFPKDMLTREEAAVILYNIVGFKNIPVEMKGKASDFIDKNDISDWAKDAVEYLYRCSIIDGFADNSFAPKANITREQTAKLVYSLLKYLI